MVQQYISKVHVYTVNDIINSCSISLTMIYFHQPFIIDGFKFDLRIYVLVTSCDPLRVYVYKDGLGRFATIKYHEPSCGNVVSRRNRHNIIIKNKNSEGSIKLSSTFLGYAVHASH